jgi:hypothetical protein
MDCLLPQNEGTDFRPLPPSGFVPQPPGAILTLAAGLGSAVAKLSLSLFLPPLVVDMDLNFIVALSSELEMDFFISLSDYLFFPIMPFSPAAKLFLVEID